MRLTGCDATVQQEFANQLLAIGDAGWGHRHADLSPLGALVPKRTLQDLLTHEPVDICPLIYMRRALDLHGMKTGPTLSKVGELVKIEWSLCLTCFEYLSKLYEALRKSAPRSVSSEDCARSFWNTARL